MLLKDIEKKFPFLSVIEYGGNEYVGIIANQDHLVTSMYVYDRLGTEEEKKKLLELGEVWWWESNRMIPINIFLSSEMENLNHSLLTMVTKDVKITHGPCVNIHKLLEKRIKRKNLQLIYKNNTSSS